MHAPRLSHPSKRAPKLAGREFTATVLVDVGPLESLQLL